jgi:hypothetical protein
MPHHKARVAARGANCTSWATGRCHQTPRWSCSARSSRGRCCTWPPRSRAGSAGATKVTVFAEITEVTLRALPGILNLGQDGYDDTAAVITAGEAADVEDLFESPIVHQILPEAHILPDVSVACVPWCADVPRCAQVSCLARRRGVRGWVT